MYLLIVYMKQSSLINYTGSPTVYYNYTGHSCSVNAGLTHAVHASMTTYADLIHTN